MISRMFKTAAFVEIGNSLQEKNMTACNKLSLLKIDMVFYYLV